MDDGMGAQEARGSPTDPMAAEGGHSAAALPEVVTAARSGAAAAAATAMPSRVAGEARVGARRAIGQLDGGPDDEELNSDDDDPEVADEDEEDKHTMYCQFEKVSSCASLCTWLFT